MKIVLIEERGTEMNTEQIIEFDKVKERWMELAVTNHAKESMEFDWLYLHEVILLYLKHMQEYYNAGNNVWQADESKNEILDQLKEVLDVQKEIEDLEDSLEFLINSPQKYLDKETELYEKFYNLIGKYIRNWWD